MHAIVDVIRAPDRYDWRLFIAANRRTPVSTSQGQRGFLVFRDAETPRQLPSQISQSVVLQVGVPITATAFLFP
jgi:hypothetical protein